MSKPTKPVVSVEVKDLLALLDAEEQKQLAAALSAGTDALEDSVDPFSGVSMTLLLREILVLRMPFVRMLNELVELLQFLGEICALTEPTRFSSVRNYFEK